MRYAEQMKYSWDYHHGIFRELWDMFTLHNWHWFIVGSLVVLCVIPFIIFAAIPTPSLNYFISTPVPAFTPSLTQELAIADYYSNIGSAPPLLAVMGWYWVRSSGFQPLSDVLCIISVGLLLVAYLREESSVRGREE